MSELFKDIPEFVETHIGESIAARTETLASFRELGPPDLCQVVKSTGSKAAQKDLGSYHYCSGVEASSSASLAAYLNSLQFSVEEPQAWFSSKASGWHVSSGVYCCFNAFSRVDMRVDVKIPGGVEAYVVDLRGERHEATPHLWLETYLSALLRSINYADDASYRLAGYRKLDPIVTPEAEQRFLEAAEELFFDGWKLGSDPEVQVATTVTNHLTAGIMKYFGDGYRLERAANLFEKMGLSEEQRARDADGLAGGAGAGGGGEVVALVARCYLGMNEEIKAVKILHSALLSNPLSYPLLHAQVDFLLSKNQPAWAQIVAQQAVNAAPSEFVTWAKLTETFIHQGKYDSALLTLNSCPMFTFNERDLHRMPSPLKTHLPVKKFIAESGILDDDSQVGGGAGGKDIQGQGQGQGQGVNQNEADVALLRLPAPGLRGTFAKAYTLLSQIVSKIGWDELLRTRSMVFVMEEEYRAHKRGETVDLGEMGRGEGSGRRSGDADGDGNGNRNGEEEDEERDDASIRGIRSTGQTPRTSAGEIPTIRISTESARTPVDGNGNANANGNGNGNGNGIGHRSNGSSSSQHRPQSETIQEQDRESASASSPGSDSSGVTAAATPTAPELEKPETAHAHAEDTDATGAPGGDASASAAAAGSGSGSGEGVNAKATVTGAGAGAASGHGRGQSVDINGVSAFSNKRLCERWLDNLFLVLYEDLRVYTIWRAEISYFKTQHRQYRKTGTEWEILGELALRLQHKEEAKDAFQRCLENKFSAKALLKLLETYANEGDLQRSLNAAVKLTVYHHRWYMDSAFPSMVAHELYKLGLVHGHAKIQYTLLSMNLAPGIFEIMQGYLKYGSTFKVEGSDW